MTFYHLLISLVKQFSLYSWKMPVIFSTVNYLHVKLFILIYNMFYKNKAIQMFYVCQIVIKEINSYFFLSSFKLDGFGICWNYKYTVFCQDPSGCVYISIQIQLHLNVDFSAKVTDKEWFLFTWGLSWSLEVQFLLCYW